MATYNFYNKKLNKKRKVIKASIRSSHGELSHALLLNKYDGNETFAVGHAAHPIAEVYPLVAPQIASANKSLDLSLYSMLVNLPEISKNSTKKFSQYRTYYSVLSIG
ncbi:MAG: hypothetical protein L0H53_10460 [Candidatus Nitrosocosmicus sp.]|nr:hypothetical protein [Candidatus Nitrosocosmicus sp.]